MDTSRESLERTLAGGPLPVERAVQVAIDVLAELAGRHARGAVHGRVTVAHVLLAGARASLDEPELAPAPPSDLAPEVLDGSPATVTSDLFGVGVLLYRALTGETPFPGRNLVEVVDSQLAGPRPLRDANPRVPPALAAVVECALSRRVGGRPQSALELTAALREAAEGPTVVVEAAPPAQAPRGRLPASEQVVFDRFLVLSVMSQRAWDVMYLVKDLKGGGRLLALRLGKPDAPFARARLEHEVAVVRPIRNQFVVRVLENGCDDGLPWTLYQPLRGTTLRARLAGGPFDVDDAVGVLVQLLEGLRAVHAAGWVHRDVKPENLIEELPETYRLAGFDIALRPDPLPDGNRAIAGTPNYMAPELFTGGPVGPATDLFTAGVVLYELLTGRPPFAAADFQQTLDGILNRPAPPLPPSSLWPLHLEAALSRAMAKRPEDRFPDAAAMKLAVLGVEQV